MSDRRPFAKIDTGYMLNPKWFQVERHLRSRMANAMAPALANAVRVAREAHLASILYCAQNMTDGVFPVRTIKSIVTIQDEAEEAAISALFDVGLWINLPDGMAEVHDYLEHQTPAELIEKRSEAGKKGARARWQTDSKSHPVANGKTDDTRNAEEKRREEKREARKRAVSLPKDWTPTDAHTSLASELGLNLQWEETQFRDKAKAKGWTYKDWDAAFRNYLRNSQKYQQRDGTLPASMAPERPIVYGFGPDDE